MSRLFLVIISVYYCVNIPDRDNWYNSMYSSFSFSVYYCVESWDRDNAHDMLQDMFPLISAQETKGVELWSKFFKSGQVGEWSGDPSSRGLGRSEARPTGL
jgi:hypothetical protein